MNTQQPSFRHLLGLSKALLEGGSQPTETLERVANLWSEALCGAGVAIHLAMFPEPGAPRLSAETAMPEVSRFIFARSISAGASAYGQMAVEIEAPVSAPRDLLHALDALCAQLADYVERARVQELLPNAHAQFFHPYLEVR